MYELIILTLLMWQPKHGYVIGKVINDIIGPYAKASNGRIYPLLSKLEETGLIEAHEDAPSEPESGRGLRSFHITDRGRERFRELMLDVTSSPREYREIFSFKVAALGLLSPAERLHLIDHYRSFCQTHIAHLTAEADDASKRGATYTQNPAWAENVLLDTIRHSIRRWQLELEWSEQLRAREVAAQAAADRSVKRGARR
jgi:DNA-binding PadR family transcriptional regulator